MVKYIVGGVIVVLSWALAIIIEFPLWIPSLITLVVLLWLLLMFGIAKLRERRAARELEKALQAQAAAQAASARPDLQHEIAEMQAEFQKAVSALKGTKKGGKKALYALPWYTIIGPPGSGKSTALRNSGIQFPYLSASGGGVRGLGGTRNCDWWMTSEAVILDTAGRWTSEDEDHDEWLGFLDLVKRFRPKKPLNGMIAAVSIGDVGGAREDEVVALARRIRERIDEVQARLSLSLPVYVLFTKCDLLPGFLETFGDMSKEERSQIWGFTAPLTKPIGPAGQYFLKGFEELVAMLDRRALKRMGEERKVASREMIFAFPQQIEVMRNNLQEFVHHLFIENVFKETPRLRGVYFTSGTQEGRPIDRVMSAMAEAFGQPQVQLPAPQVESKSYFLRDMFMSIVFRDAEVAVRSPEEIRRQRRRTYLTAGAIFTLALGISGLPALAWATNRGFLNETKEVVDSARESVAEGEAHLPIEEPAIHSLYTRVKELEENDRMGAPLFMRMGMYQSDVYEPVREVYLEAMRRRVIGPMVEADVQAMIAFGQRYEALQAPPDAEELRAMYERLKLHLLLTRPSQPLVGGLVEPEPDDDLQEYMNDQLHLRWTTVTETRRSDREYRRMREQVEYYVDALADEAEGEGEHATPLTFPRNDAAVAAVRGVLSAVGGYHMAVQGIIAEIRPLNYDIRLVQLVGQIGSMQARTMVRGAFTKRAWDERVERMLEDDAPRFFGENWVLGHPPPESERRAELERELQVAGLRSYFLEQYVQEWRNFIASLYVVRATTPQEHMQVLTEFTSGEPQLMTRLIRLIDANVSLARPEGGLSPSEVQRRAEREAQLAATRRLGRVRGLGDANAARLLGVGRAQAEQQLANNGVTPTPADMTPIRVRMQFSGFLDFAPVPPPNTPSTQAELVTPARRYEEQLEYLRDALGFRMAGTEVTNFDERQASALALTTNLIQERPLEWRERFNTLLLPPILGPAWVPPEAQAVTPQPAGTVPTPPPAVPTPTPTIAPTPAPAPAAAPTPAPTPAPTKAPRRRGAWWN